MFFRFLILSFILILLQINISSAPLSLSYFVRNALAQHPLAKISHHNYLITNHHANSKLSFQDWIFNSEFKKTRGMLNVFGSDFSPDTEQVSAIANISKVLTSSGTRLTFGSDYRSTIDQPSFSPSFIIPDFYNLNINLTVTQPLLKNSWGGIDQSIVKQSHYISQLSKLQYRKDLDLITQQLVDTYLNWYKAYLIKDILYTKLKKIESKVNILSDQHQLSVTEPLELILSKQHLKTIQILFLQHEQKLISTESALRSHFPNLPISLVPAKYSLNLHMDLKSARYYIQNLSITDKIMDLNYKLSTETLDQLKSETLPDLSLVFQHSSGSVSDSVSNLNSITDNSIFSLGIKFSQSLDNTKSNSLLKSQKRKLALLTQSHINTRRTLDSKIAQLYSSFHYLSKMIVKTDELIALSRNATRLKSDHYNQGRIYSYSSIIDSENQILDNLIRSVELSVELKRVTSQIIHHLDDYQTRFYPVKLKESLP